MTEGKRLLGLFATAALRVVVRTRRHFPPTGGQSLRSYNRALSGATRHGFGSRLPTDLPAGGRKVAQRGPRSARRLPAWDRPGAGSGRCFGRSLGSSEAAGLEAGRRPAAPP